MDYQEVLSRFTYDDGTDIMNLQRMQQQEITGKTGILSMRLSYGR